MGVDGFDPRRWMSVDGEGGQMMGVITVDNVADGGSMEGVVMVMDVLSVLE